MTKKTVPVEIIGATACFTSDARIGFLVADSLMFWVHYEDQPEFKNFKLPEGSTAWIYYTQHNRKVVGIVPYEVGQSLDQLPRAEPIEVDIKGRY